MDLQTLRCFVTTVEEGSITRAAVRLNMSQPPLSVRLQALERELGVPLLTRHGRGVEPTAAGRLLVDRARQLIEEHDAAATAVRAVGEGVSGQLVLAVGPTIAPSLLVRLLRELREQAPDVELDVADVPSDRLCELVLRREADAGLIQFPPHGTSAFDGPAPPFLGQQVLDRAVITRDPLVALLPSGHPAAASERVPLSALTRDVLIVPARGSVPGLHEHAVAAWHAAGGSPSRLREGRAARTLLGLVAAGFGVAVLPQSLAGYAWPGLVVRPLREHRPAVETAIVWHRDATSPVLRRFLRIALATPEPDMVEPDPVGPSPA